MDVGVALHGAEAVQHRVPAGDFDGDVVQVGERHTHLGGGGSQWRGVGQWRGGGRVSGGGSGGGGEG